MPTYAYACKECGHQFEQHQAFTDDALTVCPECSGPLRKIFNSVGVTFKGSGFYRTDSRAGSSSGGSPSGGSSSSSSGGSSGSGTSASSSTEKKGSTPSSDSAASTSSTS